MDKEKLHVIIAEIARGAIDIGKINKSDLLSYNKKIDDLAISIYMYAIQLHHEFFPIMDKQRSIYSDTDSLHQCEEGVNNAETQDS